MLASTNPELTHGRRASTDLPRLLQIEVRRLPAHLCDEQVRGGLGDGVDAGDVGRGRLQVPAAHRGG